MTASAHRGFTLIELLISLGIAALLLMLATPGLSRWLADSEILNAAQSVAGGLRMAQAEAIKRNAGVEFVLDPTTATGSWVVQLTDGTDIQVGSFAEGDARVAFTVAPAGRTTVTFNGLGKVDTNADASLPFDRITLAVPGIAGTRPLTVVVQNVARTLVSIKICDTAFTYPDPKACPAA